ncbi:hypothetical protein GCM10010321_82800 [Streptomyces chartreusis]|nr:hypothetical protein GCM10010321_82800 [Streptomyces chartreusis]
MAGTHRDRQPHGIPPRAVRRLRPRGTPSVREVNAVKGGPVVGWLCEGEVVETSWAVLRMEGPSTLIGPPMTYLTP